MKTVLLSRTLIYISATILSLALVAGGLVLANTTEEEVVSEPPEVGNEGAVNVTQTSAGLLGVLRDLGTAEVIEVYFEWGTTSGSYPHEISAGLMETTGLFDAHLEDLEPGTTYYFRAVASGDGTSYSEEMHFTTEEEVVTE